MVVVDEELAPGLAANAAAVMAMTLGTKLPDLVGEDFEDAAGEQHPGLITTGLPVLRAPAAELRALRARAVQAEVGVIGMPAFGQKTNDYDEFRALVARTRRARLPRPRALRPDEDRPPPHRQPRPAASSQPGASQPRSDPVQV